MTDWCTADWNALASTLGSIEWLVQPRKKDWIDVLSALLVPTIAIVGTVIAFLQWRTAHQRRKDDLFDRRYAFYKKTEGIYLEMNNPENMAHCKYEDFDFSPLASEACFLFGLKVARHVFDLPLHKAPEQVTNGIVDDWFVEPFRKYLELK